jgi:hypothetical protein
MFEIYQTVKAQLFFLNPFSLSLSFCLPFLVSFPLQKNQNNPHMFKVYIVSTQFSYKVRLHRGIGRGPIGVFG